MHKLCGPPFPALAGIKLWSGDDLLVGNDVLDDGGVVGDAAVADLPVHDPQQRTQALGSGGQEVTGAASPSPPEQPPPSPGPRPPRRGRSARPRRPRTPGRPGRSAGWRRGWAVELQTKLHAV